MSFDRRWMERDGSDDSQGRAVWALGTCVGRSRRLGFQTWAMDLFAKALPACEDTTSPRTWALALLGIHEYLRRMSGDRAVSQTGERLAEKLVDLYDRTATDDWPWFEDVASYNNARLCQALIRSGSWSENPRVTQIGIESLRWLCEKQLSPEGRFRPIGCNGFCRQGVPTAIYDQQAIEAHAMASAAIEAFDVNKDPFWRDQAHLAFDWFLGRNDHGLPIYNASTGGCYDGLAEHQVNQNQGAESTLAFLLSLAEMQRLEGSLPTVTTLSNDATTVQRPLQETVSGTHAS